MEKNSKENRIVSMNDEIYDSMFLEELEERLETDPLVPGGLINLIGGDAVPMDDCNCFAGVRDECPCHQGTLIECPCYHKQLIQ